MRPPARRAVGADRRGYLWGAVLGVAVAVAVVALVLTDLRGIPDPLGLTLLAAVPAGCAATLGGAAVRRRRTRPVAAVGFTTAAVVALATSLVGGILVGDLSSALVLLGFVAVLGALVAVLVGVVWLAVAAVRRRGRGPAGRYTLLACAVMVGALVGVVAVSPAPPRVPPMTSAAALDAYLKALVATGSPPSVSAAVVQDGRVVYEKAFGLADGPRSVGATPQTAYHWYSTTKLVTAVAVMQLVERGLVRLDDPVSRYLPFFAVRAPGGGTAEVTVANLLNHSSGIPSDIPRGVGWLHLENEPALDQTAFVRGKLPDFADLRTAPGTEGYYTNVGYHVLAAVIERVSHRTYRDYVVDQVLRPLGMNDTRFEYTPAMRIHAAVGSHDLALAETAFLPLLQPPWPAPYIREYAGGRIWLNRFLFDGDAASGLIGPASDLARFDQAVLNGGELDGARILSADSVRTMLETRHVRPAGSPEASQYRAGTMTHGIGWFAVQDDAGQYWEHGGGGPGFASLTRIYPARHLGITLMANGTKLDTLTLARVIAGITW